MLRTFRSRLLLAGLITLAAMLALQQWNAQRQLTEALRAGLAEEARRLQPLLSAALAPPLAAGRAGDVQAVVDSAVGPHGLAAMAVVDADGRTVAAAGTMGGTPIALALRHDGREVGRARLYWHDSALGEATKRLRRDGLVLGALVLAAGFGMLALAVSALSRGLGRVVEASSRLAEGEASVRVPEDGTAEVRQLAQAFNHMSAALQDQLQRVRDGEQHLRSVVAVLSEGLVVQDRDGRVTDANEAAARVMGLTLEELLGATTGRPRARLARPGEDWLPIDQRPAWRALSTGEPQFEPLLKVERHDGSHGWVQIRSEPVAGPDGTPAFVVSTLTELTRHVVAEDALRDANQTLELRVEERTRELSLAKEAAEQASRAKSEFLSRMSHELRTPLNAILGFAQLMALQSTLSDADRDRLQQIQSAGWHLLGLIDDVLDLARIEAGKMAVSLEPVALAPLAAQALEMAQPLAVQHGVSLSAAPPDDGVWVRADRRRLLQLLGNLLSNAIKYNRPQGHVTLDWHADAEAVRIAVSDTGVGLTREQQAQLFVPFTRFDGGGREGTGIGLVITRHLTELMGGTLDLASTPGHGSCFSLTLVRAMPAAAPRIAAADAGHGLPAAGRTRRQVLYVEDNPSNRQLMEQLLATRADIELHTCVDGLQALGALQSMVPDLAILDIDLPGMDGLTLCRRMRAEERLAGVPLLALTAQAMPADLRRMEAAGFDAIMTKPLDVVRLLAQVSRLLPPDAEAAGGA